MADDGRDAAPAERRHEPQRISREIEDRKERRSPS